MESKRKCSKHLCHTCDAKTFDTRVPDHVITSVSHRFESCITQASFDWIEPFRAGRVRHGWQFEYLIRTLEHCCCDTDVGRSDPWLGWYRGWYRIHLLYSICTWYYIILHIEDISDNCVFFFNCRRWWRWWWRLWWWWGWMGLKVVSVAVTMGRSDKSLTI